MINGIRLVSLTLLAALVVWTAVDRGEGEDANAAANRQAGQSALQTGNHDGPQIAARYHYRGRTQRFFQRAGGQSTRSPKTHKYQFRSAVEAPTKPIASRYHYRDRTARFFKRAVC